MRYLIYSITILAFTMILHSCSNSLDTDQLLQDEVSRREIFEKIASDHEMMTDFMAVMMADKHAQMMIKGHDGMRGMIMDGMLDNKPTMKVMMEKMHAQGMMSEGCMHSCMQMMEGNTVEEDKPFEEDAPGGEHTNHH